MKRSRQSTSTLAPARARTSHRRPAAERREPGRRLNPQSLTQEQLEAARARLERRVAAHLPAGRRLDLAVTDNRSTMISVQRLRDRYRLRVHHMFLDADVEVVRALGRYVGDADRAASSLLDRFIDHRDDLVRGQRRHRRGQLSTRTRGEVHDLQAIYDQLNRLCFDGRIDARITWGPRLAGKQRRHSIKLGSYSVEDQLIRVHPALDRPFVPAFVVEWIVFHEMLHQKHRIATVGGRRQFHSRAFLVDEASFAHYHRARAWERANVERLLDY